MSRLPEGPARALAVISLLFAVAAAPCVAILLARSRCTGNATT
jgi:hypothetical protein